MKKKIIILGSTGSIGSTTIKIIDRDKNSERPTTFLNPFSYIVARKNIKHLSQFNIEIDGGMLVVVLRFFGLRVKRKSFDMTSLAPIVFENAIKNNQSVFFYWH